MRGAAYWLLAFVVAASPAIAQAPSELRLEAGYARVRQTNDAQSDAGILAVFWRRPLETWTFLASGNVTYGRDSIAAAQAVAALSIPWSNDDRLRTEAGVAGARYALSAAGRGGNINGYVRQHFITDRGGLWGGGSAGRTGRDGEGSASFGGDAGAWGRLGFLYGSGSVALQRTNDLPLIFFSDQQDPDDINQTEFTLSAMEFVLEARGGPNSVGVSWTSRRVFDVQGADVIALSASGILQVTERIALTASAGRQLADPLRGLPQAELITSSLRVSLGRKPLPVMQRSEVARAIVEPAPGGGAELTVQVFAADTMLVEVAGDFSNWEPIPLVREQGVLVGRVRLAPGKYLVAVRINLGEWRAPRNLARVPDDYGGEAGIVIVP